MGVDLGQVVMGTVLIPTVPVLSQGRDLGHPFRQEGIIIAGKDPLRIHPGLDPALHHQPAVEDEGVAMSVGATTATTIGIIAEALAATAMIVTTVGAEAPVAIGTVEGGDAPTHCCRKYFGVWSGEQGTKRNRMGIVFLVMYRFYQANRLQVKVKNE